MPLPFTRRASPLSQRGFDDVLHELGGDAAALWALIRVESSGFGFLPDRRPLIAFERHVFHRRTGGRHGTSNADISAEALGGYSRGAGEYDRLERALRLDRVAALESASWGLAQVMGFNADKLGYGSVEQMIEVFMDGEDAQLDGALRFMQSRPGLAAAFGRKDWTQVARLYNGPAFERHDHDGKLADSYAHYIAKGTPSIEVRAAQARLAYLGFDPRGVDGLLGRHTRQALSDFQLAQGQAPTGELDDATLERLQRVAGV